MSVVEVVGLASKTSRLLELKASEMNDNLLDWLRSKGVTIASSCDGKGVCKKCGIQNDWMTCELTLKQLLERQPDGKIYIGYL